MPLTLEETTSQALSLDREERARLAHVLISSLDPSDGDFGDEWDAEIARRVGEVNQGTANGRPAAEVIRDIRAKFA